MNVEDVMTAHAECCTPGTGLMEVARQMVDSDCGLIPVIGDEGAPIGTVTDRDIACRAVAKGRNPLELNASDVMTTPCITIAKDASIDEAARLLEEHQIRRLVVVHDGKCCGVLSQGDLVRSGSREDAARTVEKISEPSEAPSRIH